jgi:membrane protease YdiL (CAAX protease family)
VFTQLSELRKAIVYYGIVFALVIGVTFLPLEQKPMLLFAMLLPTLTTLFMLLVVTRDGYSRAGWASLGLHRLGIKAWPLAVLVPLAVIGIAYGVVWSIGAASFSPPADLDAAGWATGLSVGLFQNLVIIGVTVSLGEELGWRGYLLPRLSASLGNKRGMALTGLLHGLFHMPIIFLTTYYHPDANRLIFVPLFLITFTVAGLLYGYLRLTTGSVWPASLAHSAHNYFWDFFGGITLITSPVAAEYLAGESGILIILGYGAAAAWLLWRIGATTSSSTFASPSTPTFRDGSAPSIVVP